MKIGGKQCLQRTQLLMHQGEKQYLVCTRVLSVDKRIFIHDHAHELQSSTHSN